MNSLESSFTPAWWLRNTHAQSIWPTIVPRIITFQESWERIELPDGDFIDIVWNQANKEDTQKPIVVILHGLGGSLQSTYAKGLIQALSINNLRPVFMHYRGCSGVPNRLPRGYHSGDTGDIAFLVDYLRKTHNPPAIGAIGVSLGGNVLLKWLGETGTANPLDAIVAVSPPFELPSVANRLMHGFSRIYQWSLIRDLIKKDKIKFQNIPCPFDIKTLDNVRNFWQYDDLVTAPLHGFKDVHEYYRISSCRQYLSGITKPTLIIHSIDDPFMSPDAIPQAEELSKTTTFDLVKFGGHLGFIEGLWPGNAEYWLDKRIPEWLKGQGP